MVSLTPTERHDLVTRARDLRLTLALLLVPLAARRPLEVQYEAVDRVWLQLCEAMRELEAFVDWPGARGLTGGGDES